MHKLQEHVLQNIPAFETITVGLSGGVDSVVLLHILKTISKHTGFKLSAIHINHGISANAKTWELFCQEQCSFMDIQLEIYQSNITKNGGESLENNARITRYGYFSNSEATVIALAHHKNDQVETTLSQILRGSDLHNIASMKPLSNKQGKTIWRPLLEISRNDIENYAQEFNLQYINDESNLDTTYLRNFIRHKMLPLLLEFDKDVETKILKLPKQLQNILNHINQITTNDLLTVKDNNSLLINKFQDLPHLRQLQIINHYLKVHDLPLPTTKQLHEFIRQALHSKWDSTPSLILNHKYKIIKTKNHIKIKERE